jgi:hypothetical protein
LLRRPGHWLFGSVLMVWSVRKATGVIAQSHTGLHYGREAPRMTSAEQDDALVYPG